MPPEQNVSMQDLEHVRMQIITEVFRRLQYEHYLTPSTSREMLYGMMHMWPVYQKDDIGRRVVAIYDNPASAQQLQDLIDRHGYTVEPMIQHAPSLNRLRKIFGGIL